MTLLRQIPRWFRDLSLPTAALLSGGGLLSVALFVLWLTGRPQGGPWNLWHIETMAWKDRLTYAAAVATGVGAMVALVVSYRKQRDAEEGKFAAQFAAAAAQLGHDAPAVRIAGAFAIAALADRHKARRQQCIDVLTGYLRLPYEPQEGHRVGRTVHRSAGVDGDQATVTDTHAYRPADREVRFTVIRIIRDHLRDPSAATNWCGHDLDFTGTTFDGGDFTGAHFSRGRVDFVAAKFVSGRVAFDKAKFGGRVTFADAEFVGGKVCFNYAQFGAGSSVLFDRANFKTGSVVTFGSANFDGDAEIAFDSGRFVGGSIDFDRASLGPCRISFTMATFGAGIVSFFKAQVNGADIAFDLATINGGKVSFDRAEVDMGTISFPAVLAGGHVSFNEATFFGGYVSFGGATFEGCEVAFVEAVFFGGSVNFGRVLFYDGVVDFGGAKFSDGQVVHDGTTFFGWTREGGFQSRPGPGASDVVTTGSESPE